MSPQDDQSDDAALAGEYVLHLLEAEARAAFETRLAQEPALRVLVRDWEVGFVALAEEIDPVAPRARVKTRLQQSLFDDAPATLSGASLGRSVRRVLWTWLSGGAVAAGIAVGAVLLLPDLFSPGGPSSSLPPSLTARVAAQDGSLVVAARFVAETNQLDLVRAAGGPRPGRVLELWLIAEGAAAPVSLGLLSDEPETRIDLPPALAQQLANAVLAISDEPPGGSPTGAPTGDVLAVGPVTDA